MIVNDGRSDISVQEDYLTNDLDEVDALFASMADESKARAKSATAKKAAATQQNVANTSASPASMSSEKLAKIQSLQAQIDAVGSSIQQEQNKIRNMDAAVEQRRWERLHYGKASQDAATESKYIVQQRIAALQRQQSALIQQQSKLAQ